MSRSHSAFRPPPFRPPPYPYDRLRPLEALAADHPGGVVDLSVGTPHDSPPAGVVSALSSSGAEHSYPPSVGSKEFRAAAASWMRRRLGVDADPSAVAACIGTKELVSGMASWLRLRRPDLDTVLSPAVAYPTYAMGAQLAGCRSVAVPVDDRWRLDLSAVDGAEASRALCLWVNSPANPTGALDDLAAAAEWGRARGIPVLSDECYVEFTWQGPLTTILGTGTQGVLAVHSLSKRSNLAGLRVGFYAGDPDLVGFLAEVRKHAGFMVPGPAQAAAVAALADDTHVEDQRRRYRRRLRYVADVLASCTGVTVDQPAGGFYLWVRAPGGDAWGYARDLAERAGVLVAPGDLYGEAGAGHVRVAVVQRPDRLRLVGARLGQPPAAGSDLE